MPHLSKNGIYNLNLVWIKKIKKKNPLSVASAHSRSSITDDDRQSECSKKLRILEHSILDDRQSHRIWAKKIVENNSFPTQFLFCMRFRTLLAKANEITKESVQNLSTRFLYKRSMHSEYFSLEKFRWPKIINTASHYLKKNPSIPHPTCILSAPTACRSHLWMLRHL